MHFTTAIDIVKLYTASASLVTEFRVIFYTFKVMILFFHLNSSNIGKIMCEGVTV